MKLLAIILIAANVLVPEQLVRFKPCCLDESGNLRADMAACFGKKVPSVSDPDCCQPEIVKLRQAPPSAVENVAAAKTGDTPYSDVVAVPVQLGVSVSLHAGLVHCCSPSPPSYFEILTIQSRLNI